MFSPSSSSSSCSFIRGWQTQPTQSNSTVLWRCWLGGRKGIRPVKNWVVGCWCGYLSGARLDSCIWPSWCHCHSLSLASVKSRLVLPFWYRLTWVVPDKGPLNVCVVGERSTFFYKKKTPPPFHFLPTGLCGRGNSLIRQLRLLCSFRAAAPSVRRIFTTARGWIAPTWRECTCRRRAVSTAVSANNGPTPSSAAARRWPSTTFEPSTVPPVTTRNSKT